MQRRGQAPLSQIGPGEPCEGVGSNPNTLDQSRPTRSGAISSGAAGRTVQQSTRRYGEMRVCWERQHGGALCAMHAIDGLLQRQAVDSDYMHQVAHHLDAAERRLLTQPIACPYDGNARPDGDFTVQVIQGALRQLGGAWTLTDARSPTIREQVLNALRRQMDT